MTPFNVCPACVRLNLPDARVCTTCGASLHGAVQPGAEDDSEAFVDLTEMELDADTTPSVHLDAPELQRWFNSRTGALDGRTEPTLPAETPEPDTPLTLREFEAPPPSDDDVAPANPLPLGVILADPQASPLYVPPEHHPAAPAARLGAAPAAAPRNLSPVAKAATKALRRAQVRRSLQANKGQPDAAPAPADVLVLESDDAAREQLCALL